MDLLRGHILWNGASIHPPSTSICARPIWPTSREQKQAYNSNMEKTFPFAWLTDNPFWAGRFGLVYCCLTALSAQTGYIMPQKYNVYRVGQGNNSTIQLNRETIESFSPF